MSNDIQSVFWEMNYCEKEKEFFVLFQNKINK